MATTSQLASPVQATSPIALWHLLSLDAPTVAALWTWFIARSCGVRLPATSPLAMGIAVWMLYVADRVLDAHASVRGDELESRHLFHHRHRRNFLLGMGLAGVALATLLPSLDPAAMRLYLVEGVLLLAWFLILQGTRGAHRPPKEIAVGLFFCAATFIPTIARDPFAHDPRLRLALLPPAMLFAALCSLNCLFIYAWEHDGPDQTGARCAHATTRLGMAHLRGLTLAAAMIGGALALLGWLAEAHPGTALIPAACAIAAMLLLLVHGKRRNFARTDLRAAADLALLTPLLLLPVLTFL